MAQVCVYAGLSAVIVIMALIALVSTPASAHKPIFSDHGATGFDDAIRIPDPDVSWAIYGYLDSPEAADYYYFDLPEGMSVYTEMLVPVSRAYENFRPSYAIVGPGARGQDDVPFSTREDAGRIVVNAPPGEREQFYEPFTGVTYYRGLRKHTDLAVPGRYYVVVFDPGRRQGDYVLAVGERESFSPGDLPGLLRDIARIRSGAVDHSHALEK
jgi:hypothetical protein